MAPMLHIIAAARVSGSGVGLEGKCWWSNLGGCQDKRKTVWVRIFCWGEGGIDGFRVLVGRARGGDFILV